MVANSRVGSVEAVKLTPATAQPQISVYAGGLSLEWRSTGIEFDIQPDGKKARLQAPGFASLDQPGVPMLPFSSVLVALPPGAQPLLEFAILEESHMKLPAPLALAPTPEGVMRDPQGQVLGGAYTESLSPLPLELDAVVLEHAGVMRGLKLARLTFYPARPQGEVVRLTSRVKVNLHFNYYSMDFQYAQLPLDPLQTVVKGMVVNPQHILPSNSPSPAEQVEVLPYSRLAEVQAGPMLAVEVDQAGLTRLTHDTLVSLDFPLDSDPGLLRLTRSGIEIPMEWAGDQDAAFEPGEQFLFYAEPRASRWTENDVYFLSYGEEPGLRMEERQASPQGLSTGVPRVVTHHEENTIYTPNCYCAPLPAGADGDRWVWDDLNSLSNPSAGYDLLLPAADPGQAGSLTLRLIGYTDTPQAPDHRVEVQLNGISLGTVEWDGKNAIESVLVIGNGVLAAGSNTLQLSLPGLAGVGVEGVWLDSFSIGYARSTQPAGQSVVFSGEGSPRAYTLSLADVEALKAYDVTNADQPVRLTGVLTEGGNSFSVGDSSSLASRRYWVGSAGSFQIPTRIRPVTGLNIPEQGADQIILYAADLLPALSGLVELRRSQGLKVVMVDVQAVYDTYGDGRSEPQAIRSFLSNAYYTWNPRPLYVLLVGDGTYDPKRYQDNSLPTLIPPFLSDVDPWAGETAADNRYVTVDGDDSLPDIAIGRLPVNNLVEAQSVVDKIVQYEIAAEPGSWPGKAVFVADNPDGGGDFHNHSEALASTFFAFPHPVERFYYTPLENDAGTIRSALKEAWQAGSGFMFYTGHASIHQWAVENFFHLEVVSSLSNGGRLPILLEMTCFTSSFHLPAFPALDEALLRHPAGGVVAVWGPTGLGISTGHSDLVEGFLQSFVHQGHADLGLATMAGKLNLAANHSVHGDLIDTYVLLGDPAMRLEPMLDPWSKTIYMPVIQK